MMDRIFLTDDNRSDRTISSVRKVEIFIDKLHTLIKKQMLEVSCFPKKRVTSDHLRIVKMSVAFFCSVKKRKYLCFPSSQHRLCPTKSVVKPSHTNRLYTVCITPSDSWAIECRIIMSERAILDDSAFKKIWIKIVIIIYQIDIWGFHE